MEVEIGRGKKARRAYGFDDIAIVPSRRTRDPDDVDISWTLGPYRFDLPLLAAALDGVVSPDTAGLIGKLGGLAVLNLEGIYCRYEDAEAQLERIATFSRDIATREMQDIYREPVKPELIARRIEEIKAHGVVAAASLTPQKVRAHYETALEAGLDILVIQGTVVSAEHVSRDESRPPLNLKEFIRELAPTPVVVGGCASYHTGLHLMRTGAAGVLVGCRPRRDLHDSRGAGDRRPAGHGHRRRGSRPLPAHARDRRLRQGHRRRRDAQRRRHRQGDRLRRRRGHARLGSRPRLRGAGPRLQLGHGHLPPDAAARHPGRHQANGTLEEIVKGPARENDGTFNLMGGLSHVDGDVRVPGHRRVQPRRADGRSVAADRGQAAPARAGRRHGCRAALRWVSPISSTGTSAVTATRQANTELAADAVSVDDAVRERAMTPAGEGLQLPGTDEVVVLDYGGQYSQLIARRVRECGVFSELLPHHVGAAEVARRRPKGVILSGGPASVYAEGAPPLEPALLELGVPVLGICYGMQLIARELGGRVKGAEVGEFGRSQLTVSEPGRLLAGTPAEQSCWMSHRDTVFAPPPGFRSLAASTGIAGGCL